MHSGNSKAQILALLVRGVIQERLLFYAPPKPKKIFTVLVGFFKPEKKILDTP
jgi:hypothetical protein